MAEMLFLTRRRLIIFTATFIAASALAINCSSAQTLDSAKKQAGEAKDNETGEGEKTTEEKNEWKKEVEEGKKVIVRTDLPEDHRKLSTRKPKSQKKKKQKKQTQHKKAKRRKMKRKKLKRKKIK